MEYERFLKSANEATVIKDVTYFETKNINDFNINAAYYICKIIYEKQRVNEDGYVVIGLSGGKTPIDVYKMITQIKDITIDFSKLIFFIVDERYKPLDHKLSNYNNISFLFSSLQIDEATQLYKPDTTKDVVNCVKEYNEKIKSMLDKYKKIDLVVLGMGSDFHTASLFPHVFLNIYMNSYLNNYIYKENDVDCKFAGCVNESLNMLNEYVYFTTTNSFDVRKRITVSLKLLKDAEYKVFLLNSEEKIDLWKQMLMKFHAEMNYNKYPVMYLLHENEKPNCTVFTCGKNEYTKCIKDIYESASMQALDNYIDGIVKRNTLSIIVFGCSGDLSQKKIYPALFKLFCRKLLPKHVIIIGFARTSQTFEEFFDKIVDHLKKAVLCYEHLSQCDRNNLLVEFKSKCRYYIGNYSIPEDFEKFNIYLNQQEQNIIDEMNKDDANMNFCETEKCVQQVDITNDASNNISGDVTSETATKSNQFPIVVNRILYLALPPHIFISTLKNYKQHCLNKRGGEKILLEKPFGHDLDSFKILSKSILEHFDEESIYRIDHYLGKDMVIGLMKLKFTNTFLLSLMNRHFIKCIKVTLKEMKGVYGRGQYFDPYGIIRDVMQNHMLQLLTLITMEHPADLSDESVKNEKIKILKCIPSIKLEDTIVGQYVKSDICEDETTNEKSDEIVDFSKKNHSYHDDPHIKPDSITPTFCTCVLYINSINWYGVPIIFKAGKGLNKDICEIRIQFHNIMGSSDTEMCNNEFIIILQPVEGIFLKMMLQKPGSDDMEEVQLNLTASEKSRNIAVPEAYETLLLHCMRGCKTKFISEVELYESWRIFTPLLNELEKKKVKPLKYAFGSSGPKEVYDLVKKYYNYGANYSETPGFVRTSSYYDDDLLDLN